MFNASFKLLLLLLIFMSISNAQLNLESNSINFRNYNNAERTTTHFGDLYLDGGSTGLDWGWLYANAIYASDWVQIVGDLDVWGSKNFMHPHPTDPKKAIRYVAMESSEALTISRGTAETSDGEVIIDLPEHFSLVTSKKSPISVIITPEGLPVLLYTKEKSAEKIKVLMKESDFYEFGDAAFSYQVSGVRDGFENVETIVDYEKDENPHKSKLSKEIKDRTKKLKEFRDSLGKGKKK